MLVCCSVGDFFLSCKWNRAKTCWLDLISGVINFLLWFQSCEGIFTKAKCDFIRRTFKVNPIFCQLYDNIYSTSTTPSTASTTSVPGTTDPDTTDPSTTNTSNRTTTRYWYYNYDEIASNISLTGKDNSTFNQYLFISYQYLFISLFLDILSKRKHICFKNYSPIVLFSITTNKADPNLDYWS